MSIKERNIRSRFLELEKSIQFTIKEARSFMQLLKDYESNLVDIQDELLSLKPLIQQNPNDNNSIDRVYELVDDLEKLRNPKFIKFITKKLREIETLDKKFKSKSDQVQIELFNEQASHFMGFMHLN
ncbi:MAG: hypothetical protein COB02_02030 [Candidatus Cloacimonadota bacterium]|nr:MAG: hypothetical protein COB02_02030 [Candidatus Cloacimonadota bacterium]